MANLSEKLPGAGNARKGWWKKQLPYYIVGGLITLYVALKIAPACDGNNILSGLMHRERISWFLDKDGYLFDFTTNPATFSIVGTFMLIYIFALIFIITGKKWNREGPKGNAQWEEPAVLDKKYNTKWKMAPKIMTQHVAISYNDFKHRRNMNTLIIGGSGAGKTRFYAKPNLMQGNCSFVCLDPKGELLRDTGNIMKSLGYNVKVLNLINMEESDRYNPFEYLKTETDIMRLCTNLFKATDNGKSGGQQDPFWDNAAIALLMAIVSYLHYYAPAEEQNFSMVGEMLRAAAITSESMKAKSPLDKLFDELDDEAIAKKFYRDYHVGGAKTLQSIQITLSARLNKFNINAVRELTKFDMLDLENLGEQKTVLYALIPDNDTSFNFLVSILYTQLFQTLMNSADFKHKGKLPVPVHFLMDEFANVALPDDFDKILATIRSRKISVSIIIQNMAQLKTIYEKQWESIVGNCDEFLYLGGQEQGTHEYISKSLGKETIDLNTYGRTRGTHGSSSTNYNVEGRELLSPDEVRLLDDSLAILMIRGERPCLDKKYDLLQHPNIDLGPDGKYGAVLNYQHIDKGFEVRDQFEMLDLSGSGFDVIDNVEGYSAEYLTNFYLAA